MVIYSTFPNIMVGGVLIFLEKNFVGNTFASHRLSALSECPPHHLSAR